MSEIADKNGELFAAVFSKPQSELFARVEGGRPRISGYAATYTGLSEDLGGFRTRIAPGAFDGVLGKAPDVRFLINHDPSLILGRTLSGTLRLGSDDRGLSFDADPPDTPMTAHYLEAIRRGDMDGCSFTCYIARDKWAEIGDETVRTILEVSQLFDVGPVSFPAFPDTSLSASLQASSDRARASFAAGRRGGKTTAATLRLRLEVSPFARHHFTPIGGDHADRAHAR
jgi:HK97 family phage prohead protease